MAYADLTTRDPSRVKRWLQRRRLHDALAVLRNTQARTRPRILDFGSGDGELIRHIPGAIAVESWVYEPTPSLMSEAKENLTGMDSVAFTSDVLSLESATFDYVFCLEVFEHLPQKQTTQAIAQIHRLLKPDGIAVIGVPCELFLPALLKGVFRMCRRYGDFDASPRNIFAAVLGRPPSLRPVADISPDFPYHFHHLGFDYRELELALHARFVLIKKWFSPFPVLGSALNSEVYFLLGKGPPALGTNRRK
ncbi:MAG: class I SAM-dependent methyltransferase [Rudaea sp.]